MASIALVCWLKKVRGRSLWLGASETQWFYESQLFVLECRGLAISSMFIYGVVLSFYMLHRWNGGKVRDSSWKKPLFQHGKSIGWVIHWIVSENVEFRNFNNKKKWSHKFQFVFLSGWEVSFTCSFLSTIYEDLKQLWLSSWKIWNCLVIAS